MLTQCLLVAILVFQACLATPVGLNPRITDGTDASPGEFPYQVSVRWGIPPLIDYQHTCGGSILNEYYVLTAGHCNMDFGSYQVYAGKLHLDQYENTQQVVDVERVIVHKDFKGGIAQHDIAILRLATPLQLNDKVSPVQLPAQNEVRIGNAVLTGWGSTSKDILPVLPEILQKATIPILENQACLQKFPKDIIGPKPKIYDTQICTDSAGEISACSGDSGGPLVQFDNGVPTQIGIVSWGVYPCGVNHVPSVYTRVASYVNWIYNIIE